MVDQHCLARRSRCQRKVFLACEHVDERTLTHIGAAYECIFVSHVESIGTRPGRIVLSVEGRRVEIADNGPGISSADAGALFTPLNGSSPATISAGITGFREASGSFTTDEYPLMNSTFYMVERLTDEVIKAETAVFNKIVRTMSHEVNNTMGGVVSVAFMLPIKALYSSTISSASLCPTFRRVDCRRRRGVAVAGHACPQPDAAAENHQERYGPA